MAYKPPKEMSQFPASKGEYKPIPKVSRDFKDDIGRFQDSYRGFFEAVEEIDSEWLNAGVGLAWDVSDTPLPPNP